MRARSLRVPDPRAPRRARPIAHASLSPAAERARVAAHEAGHAVVAHVLGVTVLFATIAPHGATAGRVRHASIDQATSGHRPAGALALERDLLIEMAGPLAERLVADTPDPTDLEAHRRRARAAVARRLPERTACEAAEYVRLAEGRTDVLLGRCRPAVVAVALELLAHTTLDGVALARTIRQTLGPV